MTKKQLTTLKLAVEARRKKVASLRDEIRSMIEDAEELAYSCERAEVSLQEAVDALSELA